MGFQRFWLLGGVLTIFLRSTSLSQVITEYPIPTAISGAEFLALGPDGNLWFAEEALKSIARITPGGVVTEFPVRGLGDRTPTAIAAGPDGALWFTDGNGYATPHVIGRMTTSGLVNTFGGLSPYYGSIGIAAGPDGNIWFAENDSDASSNVNGNRIGRITPAGAVTEFTVPTRFGLPQRIAAGGDGNMWFTERDGNKIGRITLSGVISEFTIPTALSAPFGIANGLDGAMWFTEDRGNKIRSGHKFWIFQ